MTREERWLRAELRLLEGRDPAYQALLPARRRRHYERRVAVLRSILQIVLDVQSKRAKRA